LTPLLLGSEAGKPKNVLIQVLVVFYLIICFIFICF